MVLRHIENQNHAVTEPPPMLESVQPDVPPVLPHEATPHRSNLLDKVTRLLGFGSTKN